MRTFIWLLVALGACTSAADKERERDEAMVAQAKADAAAEAAFVADSLALAASITVDTVKEVRLMSDSIWIADNDPQSGVVHAAISPGGRRCLLSDEKWPTLVVGDTLSCQWTAAK
ncbi:MAG: hypothetical protein H7099_00370 [Gemmatimonadaceae bacterium]|nr:hypothetical protein [Gemmatimonadaceae bacterium]